MAVFDCVLLVSIAFLALARSVHGGVSFASLPRSLVVTVAMNEQGRFLNSVESGKDRLLINWSVNSSVPAPTNFKNIKLKLCYAPPSQENRGWRKSTDDLKKDKTCQFDIATQSYAGAAGNSTEWLISKDIPGALYFVRAYAINSTGSQVAYGQSTNAAKTENIFTVIPITGRPKSLYIATACFSLFSVGSLAIFFTIERKLAAAKKGK
ncbi:hypothetical protein SELMODRAFT_152440 [Selaginella moellendorffii]|uniref:High-affinity nitrate transporter n=1 Tax=Selaginella moellendorffii TaxID=88036 RepID=D8S4I9_SELML|nr:high-affinity nitrate transporter 3.1 [Selaginella moellendorffii]EFJ20946.1 hypothetical protein SELMODRAFT_152440 [Selaginella moellendorffii]|eukprot:XP_002978289.1 high-affinity nitrate transporter 3.1 [Selaginella moellendorffii]